MHKYMINHSSVGVHIVSESTDQVTLEDLATQFWGEALDEL